MMMLLCLSWGLVCSGAENITYPELKLMPYPANLELKEGRFRLKEDFRIVTDGKAHPRLFGYASRFLRRLDGRTGLFFEQEFVLPDAASEADLIIKTQRAGDVKFGEDESYTLEVQKDRIILTAENDIGALRGLETLLQLLDSDEEGYYFPAIAIEDQPRFPWRGLMIDVARHFQPLDVIKRNLDGMAAVKMNVLHLHLSDDQGFRVESRVYPQLHELASDGQYYTHEDIREIVSYAGMRGIRVIPEFDVPGHATSWLVAFPELASAPGPYVPDAKNGFIEENVEQSMMIPEVIQHVGTYRLERNAGIFDPTLNPILEETYEVLNNFIGEMAPLFPDAYFHIGGDENEGRHWDANPQIQEFMKKNNIADNHELQTYFNKRLLKILSRYNKKMIGWDEILQPDLPKSALIHSWRGQKGLAEAARSGYQTILSNGYYIDLLRPAYEHYLNDPLPSDIDLTEEQKTNVLGGEATMWSELVTPLTIDSRIWPRTAAIAERLWSPAEVKDVEDMYRRLEYISFRLEEHGLTHQRNRQVILRNLTNGKDTEALEILANVAEPLKGYTRNPGGTMYKSYSPFTLFADATIADAPDARVFNSLVIDYLNHSETVTDKDLKEWLTKWSVNHEKLMPVISESPALRSVEGLSANLSAIARLGLEAMDGIKNKSAIDQLQWFNAALEKLEEAREQGARTELQVVNSIEQLVKKKTATLAAFYSDKTISIDGNLTEWEGAEWNYFVPVKHYLWNDSSHFAIQWDEEYLYMAFKVQNSNLQAQAETRDADGLHMDDGIEFLIDTDFDRAESWKEDDIAYHVNVSNVILDDRGVLPNGEFNNGWNGKTQTAVKTMGTINNTADNDKGYLVEVAVSWKELGRKPQDQLMLGINLCVNDRDDITGEYRYFDYMNLPVFHVPVNFAKLVLIKNAAKEQSSIEQE